MVVWATLGSSGGEQHVYVASSATGQTVLSASSATPNAGIGVSQDYGASWTYFPATADNIYTGVAISKDGLVWLAIYGNTILRSTDLGATWNATTTTLDNNWIGTFDGTIITTDQYQSVALNGHTYHAFPRAGTYSVIAASADGSILLAKSGTGASNTSALHRSTDFGVTWTQIFFDAGATITGSGGDFGSAASSADGSCVAVAWRSATANVCFLYMSNDGGTTWNAAASTGIGQGYWSGVACTSDGSVFLASNYAAGGGGHGGTPNNAALLTNSGTLSSVTTNTINMTFVTSATISDDGNYAIIGGSNGVYRFLAPNPMLSSVSPSTSDFVGASYASATLAGTSTSTASFIGRTKTKGVLSGTSPSTSALQTRTINTQSVVGTSVSTANLVGGSRATATFATTSTSTSNLQASATAKGIVASASTSTSALQSVILASNSNTLPAPASSGIAVFTPELVTVASLQTLPKPVLHAVAGYVPGAITITAKPKLPKPIIHAVVGYVPSAITASAKAIIPAPASISQGGLASALNIYLWGAQIEAGPGATSYIPTSGTAVTRAADNLVITTIANPYAVTLDTLILCSLAQAILDYTPQTSNEAIAILNQYVTLFDTTIAPASDLGWINTVSALTKLRTAVLQYLQQQISVEPTIQLQTFGDQLPAAVAAYILYGDASRTDELVASNDPANPLYMPLQVTYNNS